MTGDRETRGNRARQELVETEAAFAAVDAAIMKTMAETPIGQDAKILKLHMAQQHLTAVRNVLMSVYHDGLLASDALAQEGLTSPY